MNRVDKSSTVLLQGGTTSHTNMSLCLFVKLRKCSILIQDDEASTRAETGIKEIMQMLQSWIRNYWGNDDLDYRGEVTVEGNVVVTIHTYKS